MLVKEVMSTNPICIAANETASAAARLLSRHNIGALPVVQGKKLVGIVTDRDLVLRCVAAGTLPDDTPVARVMSQRLVTVSPGDTLQTAAEKMSAEQVRRLPVVEGRELVGMLSLGDLAKLPDYTMEAAACLCDVCDNVSSR